MERYGPWSIPRQNRETAQEHLKDYERSGNFGAQLDGTGFIEAQRKYQSHKRGDGHEGRQVAVALLKNRVDVKDRSKLPIAERPGGASHARIGDAYRATEPNERVGKCSGGYRADHKCAGSPLGITLIQVCLPH